MARSITLYAGDYGHTLRARTYCDDVGDATARKIVFKNVSSGTTATLNANRVLGDTTYYAIETTIPSGWTDTRTGEWIGQAQLTFSTGIFHGESFRVVITTRPTT